MLGNFIVAGGWSLFITFAQCCEYIRVLVLAQIDELNADRC